MSTERLPCKNPECTNTILPATAKANDGLCAPCIGAIREAERDQYIRRNRRTVNLYEGVSDPVEIACIMLKHREYDPLIVYASAPTTSEELFGRLDQYDQLRLTKVAADAITNGETDFAEDIGKFLATLTDANLDCMLHAWLDVKHVWPSVTFRNAGPSIRDRILDGIERRDLNMNHALRAIAWIGDDTVQRKLAGWKKEPPQWRKALRVGPAEYAKVGGWELLGHHRRSLCYDQCLALEKTEDLSQASEVHLLTERDEACPWCGDRLVHLLEIPASRPEFAFLKFVGAILPVLTCERCTCWSGHLFAQVSDNGLTALHPANQKSHLPTQTDFEWERGPWQGIAVRLKHRRAIHAVDWCMELSATQIGGLPTWVQDTAYPSCPDCSRTMMFLAQIDNGCFCGHEGTYYAFWCGDCRVTATTYQQT
ncbi:MAG: hypothetical protein V4689_03920 [Verrucomicrobiota bacterium]